MDPQKPESPKPPVEPPQPAAAEPVAAKHHQPSKPRDWKEAREWITLGIAVLALLSSSVSIFLSLRSSSLEQNKYDESHAIVVVGDLLPDETPKGMIFKFHAQDPSQRLNNLQITVPSVFKVKPWESWPANQQLTLFPIEYPLGDLMVAQYGRTKGNVMLGKVQIPVVFDARYTVSGVSMERRGLYLLRALVQIDEDKNHLPTVDFQDFDFVQGVAMDTDPQKLVDQIMEQGRTQMEKKANTEH